MSGAAAATPFDIRLTFHGDLPTFLGRRRSDGTVTRTLKEKTSLKDVIESCGVPHTEVDLVVRDGAAASFADCVAADANVDVYAVPAPGTLFPNQRLQRRNLTAFVADGHLGKLARDLRLLGIDVAYHNLAADRELVEIAVSQARALLTRDRRLLMHAAIRDGYCPRSTAPDDQVREVLQRFELAAAIAPFTRCIDCNGLTSAVAKEQVLHQLEPLTRRYYEEFRRCGSCGKVYWSGSHFGKLQARIALLRAHLLP